MEEEAITVNLDFRGAVRVKALPRIAVFPKPVSSPLTVDHLLKELSLGGTCDNVRCELTCTLTWLFLPEGEQDSSKARKLAHPGPVLLVPKDTSGQLKGKEFELKAQTPAGAKPLVLDVLHLGLYGQGRLGYELAPVLQGATPVTLEPSRSQISVDLRVGLELLDRNKRPLRTSNLKVGTQYRFRPSFSSAFADKRVRIAIYETGTGYSGERGLRHQFDRTVKASPSEADCEAMVVGFRSGQLDYRSGQADTRVNPQARVEELEYAYTIEFLKKAGKNEVVDDAAVKADGVLFRLPKPRLEALELSMRPAPHPTAPHEAVPPSMEVFERSVLHLQGRLQGFEAEQWTADDKEEHLRVALTASLFAHYKDGFGKSTPKHVPLWLWPTTVQAIDGHFSGVLDLRMLTTDEWKKLVEWEPLDLTLFAVLRFSTVLGIRAEKKGKGESSHPMVFADVAEYAANASGSTPTGFTPMGTTHMTSKALATGVCSNLVDMHGKCRALGYEASLYTEWKLWKPEFEVHQNDYNSLIQEYADRINFDALTFKSMIAQESSFDPNARNAVGYAGLTQAGPSAVQDAKRSIGNTKHEDGKWIYDLQGDDRFKPELSVEIGADCMRRKAKSIDDSIKSGGYTVAAPDRVKLIVAAYNIGERVIEDACKELAKTTKTMEWVRICGAGDESSPLWKGIAKHPAVLGEKFAISDKYAENSNYVQKIFKRLEP